MLWTERLSETLGISVEQCRSFLLDASRKYKVFTIPKRSFGRRYIAQPSKLLKEYQRAFIRAYSFPIHPCAMGYVVGKSIKDNALAHAGNPYILKVDLSNFFHSIRPSIFWRAIELNFPASERIELQSNRELLEELLFWRPSRRSEKLILSIGAPSSPTISNFCMYSFDEVMQSRCQNSGILYTRYVDDLTFSTREKGILPAFLRTVELVLHLSFNGMLRINPQKTILSSKAHNRHITGLTITPDEKISIGREKKRYIKHLIHKLITQGLPDDEYGYLRGYLAFIKHVEPEFIDSLQRKYASISVNNILKSNLST